MYWAGCNYYVNDGSESGLPKGTATSMHDCDNCEEITHCLLKKETDTWNLEGHGELLKEERKRRQT